MDPQEQILFKQRIKIRLEEAFGTLFINSNKKSASSFLDSVMEMVANLLEQERKAAIPISPAAHKVEDYQNMQAQKDAHFADCTLTGAKATPVDDKLIAKDRTSPAHRYALYANALQGAGVKHITAELLVAIDHIHSILTDWSGK